jgi:hypothetical protein
MPWDDFSDITNKAYDLFWNAAVGIAAETIGGYANAWTGSDEVGDFVTQGIQNLAGNGNADYFGIPGIPGGGFGAIMPGGGPSDQIVPYPAPGTQIFNPNWNNGNDTITGSPGGIPAAPGTQPFNPNWSYGTGNGTGNQGIPAAPGTQPFNPNWSYGTTTPGTTTPGTTTPGTTTPGTTTPDWTYFNRPGNQPIIGGHANNGTNGSGASTNPPNPPTQAKPPCGKPNCTCNKPTQNQPMQNIGQWKPAFNPAAAAANAATNTQSWQQCMQKANERCTLQQTCMNCPKGYCDKKPKAKKPCSTKKKKTAKKKSTPCSSRSSSSRKKSKKTPGIMGMSFS